MLLDLRVDHFARVFRDEHRLIRDTILSLIELFQAREMAPVRPLLGRLAALTGPHFRYEEEALYPALVSIFGEGYVRKLLGDHDRAIGTAVKLVALAEPEEITPRQSAEAARLLRRLLPHVSDCDGLSIMAERLPEGQVQGVLDARERALAADLDLLRWANEVRGRRYLVP